MAASHSLRWFRAACLAALPAAWGCVCFDPVRKSCCGKRCVNSVAALAVAAAAAATLDAMLDGAVGASERKELGK